MPRPSKAPQRREQIVWALYECLALSGHEKVTVKDIAARAGLPPGVIHYYFKNKDEIVANMAEAIIEKYSALLETHVGADGPRKELVGRLLDFIADELVFNRKLNRVFYNLVQMAFERETLHQVMKSMLKAYRGRIERFFRDIGVGGNSRALASAVVAVTEGYALQWTVEPRFLKRADIRRLIETALAERLEKEIPE